MELLALRRSIKLLSLFLVLNVIQGCSESPQEMEKKRALLIERALTLSPADPEIAEIYTRSCRSCHSTGATTAPLTGDLASWKPRMNKGVEVLVENAINGFQGMPPLGLCFECSPEQFEQLIVFMATAE
ncbi:c-type cytochrome [Microbulbifer sp. SSSA002]|uniref:c-type cytochrome n=1 Tax=unclassified Microbulbifer TaxID=2619833 RepID=UPI004039396A